MGIQNWFISVEHPDVNGQAEVVNKIIFSGMKKKLDEAKGLWAEYLHKILWSYHTTPYSTTRETPFRMVYSEDAMVLVEINTPTLRHLTFDKSINSEGLDVLEDLFDEIRETNHVREFSAK